MKFPPDEMPIAGNRKKQTFNALSALRRNSSIPDYAFIAVNLLLQESDNKQLRFQQKMLRLHKLPQINEKKIKKILKIK